MSETHALPGTPTPLQTNATSGNGGILSLNGTSEELNVWIEGSGTISGGVITIEEAYYNPTGPAYAGTWARIVDVTASTLTGGAGVMAHYPGNFYNVRARISTPITGGGNVTAKGWGS